MSRIAKVTIEISEDSVTATKRDFQTTFPEKLSIISRGPTINDYPFLPYLS